MSLEVEEVARAGVARIQATGAGRPDVALILGSGLGHIADRVENAIRVPASDMPGYPPSTVEGHEGVFVMGRIEGVSVAVLSGRIHGYEGHSPPVLGIPARILCALGPKTLMLTNAAGGIVEDFRPGDLMLISDHLNLTTRSPLQGVNVDEWGPRFPDMTEVYSADLRAQARTEAATLGLGLREGVYAWVPGPQYETPAEIRMLRTLGADAVGMSTVPEATIASHMGLSVLAVSVISNQAAGMSGKRLSHDEVLAACATAGQKLGELLVRLVASFRTGG
ncbi:MAG: purine-nucleoside phosphorylase [Planctomycetes bacterium]|nr:purine-nucleoside phosphorylase [Planctomycetota bacterium]